MVLVKENREQDFRLKFYDIWQLAVAQEANLTELVAKSEGNIQVFIHPFAIPEFWSDPNDVKVRIKHKERVLEAIVSSELPIVIFEERRSDRMDHTKVLLISRQINSPIYYLKTNNESPEPYLLGKSSGERWLSIGQRLRELGVKKISLGGRFHPGCVDVADYQFSELDFETELISELCI